MFWKIEEKQLRIKKMFTIDSTGQWSNIDQNKYGYYIYCTQITIHIA